MSQIRLTHFGVDGSGRTVTEAKQDAGRKIQALVKELRFPSVYRFPTGIIGVVARTLDGWSYALLYADQDSRTDEHAASGYGDQAATIAAMRRHAAQNLVFEVPDHGLSVLVDDGARREHIGYVNWQLDYRALRAAGKSEHEAHEAASTRWKHWIPEGFTPGPHETVGA